MKSFKIAVLVGMIAMAQSSFAFEHSVHSKMFEKELTPCISNEKCRIELEDTIETEKILFKKIDSYIVDNPKMMFKLYEVVEWFVTLKVGIKNRYEKEDADIILKSGYVEAVEATADRLLEQKK
jgi:hypothetical protein